MGKQKTASKPSGYLLDGLRVVEFGQWIGAPLVGLLLAEQGAEVVRVIDSSRPSDNPVLDAILARGKVEKALDLAKDEDRETLRGLLARADVLVDNLPAGTLQEAGLDGATLREENPGLIACRLPAFPEYDPRSSLPGYEAVAGAAGYLYEKPIGKPQYFDFPISSVMAGLYGAGAIAAALLARLKGGKGQDIEVSMVNSSLFAQILQILIKTGIPRGFLPMKMIGTPFMSPWLCQDQRYIYLHITLPLHAAQILEILEENGCREHVRKLRGILSEETMRDPSQVKSIQEAKDIRKAYEEVFITKSADEWERILGEELCCIKVRTVDEWLDDSMAADMTDVTVIDDPIFGEIKAPGAAIIAPEHPPRLEARKVGPRAFSALLKRWEAHPRTDEEILANPPGEMPRHPLEGYRVMDLSRVIAGPCGARVLAELGAEVITVQHPTSLDWALSFHLVFNTGKKSVSLDFKSEEGKQKLWALLEKFKPHVFIQNYRHLDVAREIGIEPEAIHGAYPDMVYTHLNAYGNEGGWKDRPGFEQVVQAVTGIQMAYGTGGKPKLLPSPVIDIGSGLSGAFATILGLYHREKTGQGIFSSTHLTHTAILFQVNRVASGQREQCLTQAAEKRKKVEFDPSREVVAGVLRVRGLWSFACVAGPRADVQQWLRYAALPSGGDPADRAFWEAVSRESWKQPLEHWRRSVRDAGVGETVVLMPIPSMRKMLKAIPRFDPRPLPVVRKRHFPECPSELTFVASPVRMSLTPLADIAPPHPRGADTREVLGWIGEDLPAGAGKIPYPEAKPLLTWLSEFVRWAYFAWRSGNI
jgi:crotonobetainyl-CoA:carnitine CoA-transferase CaiB-like acyl-CoA transferase